jgi:hypothetical protein
VNPGTPAYVGYLCIILRRQKRTSRYICITPLLVKLAYFLPPKKLWCDCIFFLARAKYVRPQSCAEAHSGQNQNFFSVLSELFLRVLCLFRALAAAREQSRALLFRCARSLLLAEITSVKPAAHYLSSFQYPPKLCARKACCSQSSPLSASYTNHTFFRRTELWKPFVAEPQKQSMNSLPSLAAVAGQPLPSDPVAGQSAPPQSPHFTITYQLRLAQICSKIPKAWST